MKLLHFVIIAFTILLLVPLIMNNPAKAVCMINPDWPNAPCYGCPDCIPDQEKQRQDWDPYYEYKGGKFMETMKNQMIEAMKNGTIEDWVNGNQSNYDVWRYYYVNNDAPFFRSSVSGLNDEHPYFPPPLQQLTTGIAPKDVACKKGLDLVIKTINGSPACVKLDTAYNLMKRGWAASESVYPGNNSQFALYTNSTIIPGHLPRTGVKIPYSESSQVRNYSGFAGVYNTTLMYSGMLQDYVLEPGNTGTMTFEIKAQVLEQPGETYHAPLPKFLNLTNYAVFYHEVTSIKELAKYPGTTIDGYDFKACSTGPAGGGACIGGESDGKNPIEAYVTDHPGVNVLFEPPVEALSLGSGMASQAVTMTISADGDAPKGTYLVIFSPFGQRFLFTVGNQPYHE